MRSITFGRRVSKEIRRDPLSYIFCICFPIVMLVIMSIVDTSIPPQANMTVFHVENLTPGMAYFGLTFVMLFTSIQVSRDRTTALLLRLYASPMKSSDFIIGYTLPMLALGIVQMVVCFAAGIVVALVRGGTLPVANILVAMGLLLPSLLMFVGIGILFGSAVSDKTAPGLCSIIISVSGMIGGIWMDVDGLGGTIKKIAAAMPFYHGVKLARMPFADSYEGIGEHLLWTIGFGVVFCVLAAVVFGRKMQKDLK